MKKPLGPPRPPKFGLDPPKLVEFEKPKLGPKLPDVVEAAARKLRDLLPDGEPAEDLAEALRERADQELRKLKPLADFGAELARHLSAGRARRFVEEIVFPVQHGRIDSPTAAKRTNDTFGQNVLANAQGKWPFGGGVTIAIGVGASAGAGLGYEACAGVAMTGFLDSPRVFETQSRTLHAGTVDVSVSGGIEFSVGAPEHWQPAILAQSPFASKAFGWDGWGLGWCFGGGWGATLSVAVGFTPEFRKPVTSWKFKSLAVQFGGGGGAELGMWLQGAVARELPPGKA